MDASPSPASQHQDPTDNVLSALAKAGNMSCGSPRLLISGTSMLHDRTPNLFFGPKPSCEKVLGGGGGDVGCAGANGAQPQRKNYQVQRCGVTQPLATSTLSWMPCFHWSTHRVRWYKASRNIQHRNASMMVVTSWTRSHSGLCLAPADEGEF
jgi:hypothetical protein